MRLPFAEEGNADSVDLVLTEDSNAGNEFYQNVSTVHVRSAAGKSNIQSNGEYLSICRQQTVYELGRILYSVSGGRVPWNYLPVFKKEDESQLPDRRKQAKDNEGAACICTGINICTAIVARRAVLFDRILHISVSYVAEVS